MSNATNLPTPNGHGAYISLDAYTEAFRVVADYRQGYIGAIKANGAIRRAIYNWDMRHAADFLAQFRDEHVRNERVVKARDGWR